MSDKKKYTVKRFAKMLTVHADKKVTFQDVIDVRNFVALNQAHFTGGPWHDSLGQFMLTVVGSTEALNRGEELYWQNIVEHGQIFLSGAIAVRAIKPQGPYMMLVEFEIPAVVLGEWLAATGFPQISRAKEEPNAESDVTG